MKELAYTHLKNFSDDYIPEYRLELTKDYKICPECKEILECLYYEMPGYEHGNYCPDWQNQYEENGYEPTEEAIFSCPYCSHEILGWNDCESLSYNEKEVLIARVDELNNRTWNIENFKKKKRKNKAPECTEKEEIKKKDRITKITKLKICKYCKRVIPKLEEDNDKNFCPFCMKEYHEEKDSRPIF